MKKSMILVMILVLLFTLSAPSAFADFTELSWKGASVDKKTGNCTELLLYDGGRELKLTFNFEASKDALKRIRDKSVHYYYDYTNNYLFIKNIITSEVLYFDWDVNEAYFEITPEVLDFNPEASYKDFMYDPHLGELIYIGDLELDDDYYLTE